jgi:hypothetical protein
MKWGNPRQSDNSLNYLAYIYTRNKPKLVYLLVIPAQEGMTPFNRKLGLHRKNFR